ncbi:hypothetical protein GOBAR_DD00670 [Gossypium barbadense]|nr:hypothetical protein GOBAR_DD00670 [Gossypium barbadense]
MVGLARSFGRVSMEYGNVPLQMHEKRKELAPKLNLAKKHLSSQFHVNFPDIEVRQLVLTAIAMKGLGAILFVFGHGFGAFLLVRISFLSVCCTMRCVNFLLGNEELDNKEAEEESPEVENCLVYIQEVAGEDSCSAG